MMSPAALHGGTMAYTATAKAQWTGRLGSSPPQNLPKVMIGNIVLVKGKRAIVLEKVGMVPETRGQDFLSMEALCAAMLRLEIPFMEP